MGRLICRSIYLFFFFFSQMDWLGQDLVPGLKGSRTDRIAILSKGQSFKIADVCDTIPDRFCVGLHWDVTEGMCSHGYVANLCSMGVDPFCWFA